MNLSNKFGFLGPWNSYRKLGRRTTWLTTATIQDKAIVQYISWETFLIFLLRYHFCDVWKCCSWLDMSWPAFCIQIGAGMAADLSTIHLHPGAWEEVVLRTDRQSPSCAPSVTVVVLVDGYWNGNSLWWMQTPNMNNHGYTWGIPHIQTPNL